MTVRIYLLPDDVGRRYVDRNTESSGTERSLLKKLMQDINLLAEAWRGDVLVQSSRKLLDSCSKKELQCDDSLFYIFNTITIPTPSPKQVECQYSREAIVSLLDEDKRLDGLQTDLYSYQKRSAATMVRRETQPAHVLDPRLEAFEGPEGDSFYYDQETGVFLRDERTYEQARGGILAETMGHGKTLICLAAILATRGHWPSVPPEYSVGRSTVRETVGTLADMAAAAIGRNQIPWRAFFQDLSKAGEHHGKSIALLEKNIGSYVIPPPPSGRTRRPSTTGQTIRLCSATLVVVPLNLFTQWQNEMARHLEPEALKVLSVQALDTPMPSEEEILTCDLLLISKQRFEREMKPLEINNTTKKTIKCICPKHQACNCAAAGPNYHSSLRKLHFLRIVVDEGHDFASSGGSNNAIWALRRLHVDRRWVVSGTPSTGLIGVEVGLAASETSDSPATDDPVAALEVQNKASQRTREWESEIARLRSKADLKRMPLAQPQEYKDLQRLGRIVVDFLGLRPWANTRGEDPASWQKYVLPAKEGTRRARSLRSLLENLVVRHRIDDIEKDIKLPALHNRVLYLEPSWHDKLSINLFLLVLTANAVTSERCDQDYMFHPTNRGQLHTLINNLRQSGFYWTSFTPENITKTIDVSLKYTKEETGKFRRGSGRRMNDGFLLREAIKVGRTALESSTWSAIARLHELGLYVEDFPVEAREAWSMTDSGTEPLFVGASQLIQAQQSVDSRLYASDPAAGLVEEGTAIMRNAWRSVAGHGQPGSDTRVERELWEDGTSKTKRQKQYGHVRDLKILSKHTVSKAKKGALSPRKHDQKISGRPNPSSSNATGNDRSLKSAFKAPSENDADMLPVVDPTLAKTRLCGTASSKLSYLIDRILEVQAEEKSLIFFEGDNIAYYIAQAFELVDIRFLIYTGSLTTSRKNAYIHTFNATDTFRVMLMDVRQAAHGLHIACASRVFFVNPVWQPNIEAQAIKRAHRIGQSRPVFVETLVLKDTLEHQMLSRRKNMTGPEHFKAEKSLLDDPIMSGLIKDAKFIPFTKSETQSPLCQMAPLKAPQQLFGRARTSTAHGDDADADLVFPDGKNSEIKQRGRKVNGSPQYAPDLTLSPLSRERRDLNLHNDGDYLSPTREHAVRLSSDAPYQSLESVLQSSPSFAPPERLIVGAELGLSPKKKKVGFAIDDEQDQDSGVEMEMPTTPSGAASHKRSAAEALPPRTKRVAFGTNSSAEPDANEMMHDVNSVNGANFEPSSSGSLFGNGAANQIPHSSDDSQPGPEMGEEMGGI